MREPMYFQDGADALFGWYHHAAAEKRDCVAVVCNPIGHEYTHSHRSLRHLADRLARQGVPAFRFDYHGTGDSPGSDEDPDRWGMWQRNLRAAIRTACERSGRKRVCLIGLRLGGTLATLAAREIDLDLLVLWNPCVRGKAYVRELQAIASTSGSISSHREGLEAAGFFLSSETVAAIQGVDLLQEKPKAGRVLLVDRDDLAGDAAFTRHLAAAGIAHDRVVAPGYAQMMAEHQFSLVPEAALESIAHWVQGNSGRWEGADAPASTASKIRFHCADDIEEQLCRFGEEDQLFGILSRPVRSDGGPAVVLFNAGAVHHVGPHRLNVMLARELAAAGFACLRFDLESLGDSVLRAPGRENHPYPPNAGADARAALDYLQRRFGFGRFVGIGLCSGAHTAFHAAVDLDEYDLSHVLLINPLTFHWFEGLSLETSAHFRDALAYRKSMRKLDRWMKLFRGQAKLGNLCRVAFSQAKQALKSRWQSVCEALLPHYAPRLSRQLKKLFAMDRAVSLFIAEGDPGRDILLAGARRTAMQALKNGRIRLQTFAGADHTFTRLAARQEMIHAVCDLLQDTEKGRKRVTAANFRSGTRRLASQSA